MERTSIISDKLFIRRIVAISFLSILLLLGVFCGYLLAMKNQKVTVPSSAHAPASQEPRTWCVLKSRMADDTVQKNIDYACGFVDCSIIKKGGNCYLPVDQNNYASVVMNLYYQSKGRNSWNCDFDGSGYIVYEDPSYGSCVYA